MAEINAALAQLGSATPQPQRTSSVEKAAAAAEEFEGVFISVMLKQMFAGLKTEVPFGGGQAEETFRGLMVDEYGKMLAGRGGLGLAEHVQRELLALQDVGT